jgi:hypothetical protein
MIHQLAIEEHDPMSPRLRAIYRYPVKGLTPHALDAVTLEPGKTLPFDRAWAIENGPGKFDERAPRYLPKVSFLMLMRNERLAALQADFDEETGLLTICLSGKHLASGDLGTKPGRQALEAYFAHAFKDELRGPPRIVAAPGHSFSDVSAKCVHIVNLTSVAELERAGGQTIDPLRFRANLYLDGLPAWAEHHWLDKEIGIGAARLKVFDRTTRCDATNVDPRTGARDMAIPALLQRKYGHSDFGVYAKVTVGGRIACNDAVTTG